MQAIPSRNGLILLSLNVCRFRLHPDKDRFFCSCFALLIFQQASRVRDEVLYNLRTDGNKFRLGSNFVASFGMKWLTGYCKLNRPGVESSLGQQLNIVLEESSPSYPALRYGDEQGRRRRT